jgi:hypothetical protein
MHSRSIVICFVSYRDILEANAARFVITHKIHSTKYDDPGIKPKLHPKKHVSICLKLRSSKQGSMGTKPTQHQPPSGGRAGSQCQKTRNNSARV